jgi:hypothetical protein
MAYTKITNATNNRVRVSFYYTSDANPETSEASQTENIPINESIEWDEDYGSITYHNGDTYITVNRDAGNDDNDNDYEIQ